MVYFVLFLFTVKIRKEILFDLKLNGSTFRAYSYKITMLIIIKIIMIIIKIIIMIIIVIMRMVKS